MRGGAFETGEGFVSADRDPSSGATRHLLPQGEKGDHAGGLIAESCRPNACSRRKI